MRVIIFLSKIQSIVNADFIDISMAIRKMVVHCSCLSRTGTELAGMGIVAE